MEQFALLKQHKANKQQADFNEVLAKFLPRLERYIRHRIKTAEAKRLLPINFYSEADVLAEVYLKIYEKFDDIKDEKQLKAEMFRLADEIIQEYIRKESKLKKRIPVDKLLAEELKILREELTANADGEPVLIEELDDISYHQDEFKPKIFLFDKDAQNDFARSLGLKPEDFDEEKFRSIFGSLYAQLPETIRRILDLTSIGGLTPEETALVMNISVAEVNDVLEGIKWQLDKNK